MKRSKEIEKVIARAQNILSEMPEGRVALRGRYFQFHGKDGIRYLHAPEEEDFIRTLVEKRYMENILQSAKKEQNAMKLFQKHFPAIPYEKVYDTLPPRMKELAEPLALCAERRREWEQKPFRQKKPPKSAKYVCPNGLRVRSKSEVLIVSRLLYYGVPFRYECGIYMSGYGWVYPDFTIYKPRSETEVIYEHFGMMDDEDYRNKAARKLLLYQENGFVLGPRFTISVESREKPLSIDVIDRYIKDLFLEEPEYSTLF